MISKDEIKDFAALAEKELQHPNYESTTDVQVLGEVLQEPIYWKGRQWAVTSFGIEARNGKYHIKGDRVWKHNEGHGWVEQMADKDGIDLPDFVEAVRLARTRWPKI